MFPMRIDDLAALMVSAGWARSFGRYSNRYARQHASPVRTNPSLRPVRRRNLAARINGEVDLGLALQSLGMPGAVAARRSACTPL